MKERPVIFSGPMVRAVLDGRKTQSRRTVRDAPADTVEVVPSPLTHRGDLWDFRRELHNPKAIRCPYGAPGDRLWVREAWNRFDPEVDCPVPIPVERLGKRAPFSGCEGAREIRWTAVYRADGEIEHPTLGGARWKPGIFIPRWASRITLEIVDVRVQRLQEISEDDARAEGVRISDAATARQDTVDVYGMTPCRAAFAALWESINGKRASWASNPWVWALTFKRLAGES